MSALKATAIEPALRAQLIAHALHLFGGQRECRLRSSRATTDTELRS